MKKLKFQLFVFGILLISCNVLLAQNLFTEHVVFYDFGNAVSIAGADLDGDGDIDMVASAFSGNYVAWMENDGMQNFTKHMIIEDFGHAFVLDIAHIDDDDDYDIVCAAKADDMILWFDNDGFGNFTIDTVVTNWESASFVMAKDHFKNLDLDIDGDGDTDILATSNSPGDKVSWFENDGNQNFTEHIVKEDWTWARYSTATDLDLDGDMDIVGTAKAGEIIWFVNDDYQNFTEDTVIANWGQPSSVQAADIDEDGDIDLAATSVTAQEVAWFENINNDFTKHTIRTDYNGAFSVAIADFNDDGNMDIAAEAWIDELASVYYNDGDENFTEEIFSETAYELIKIFVTDLDLDGDHDILGATYAVNDVRWWENSLYNVSFGGTPSSGHAPLTVEFTDSSNLALPINQWAWDFNNDGIIDSNVQNTSWIYGEPGMYSVNLEIQTDSITKKIIYHDYISVFDGESALIFDGAESYVICPASPSLNLTYTFTVESWIKPTTYGEATGYGFGRIIDKENIVVYLNGTYGSYNDSSLMVQIKHSDGNTSDICTPENSISTDEWQHIAVTYNEQSILKIYINGIEQELTIVNPISGGIEDNNDIDLIIGNSTTFPMGTFNGIIDEVRIWNITRTEEHIQNNMDVYLSGDEDGLIGYWKMNEGFGKQIADSSSNTNTGNLFLAKWCQGKNLEPFVSIEEVDQNKSENYFNLKNYPNPFLSETTISYTLYNKCHIKLSIFDITGKFITNLIDCEQAQGYHTIIWNGKTSNDNATENGIYFYRLKTDNYEQTKQMIKLKIVR